MSAHRLTARNPARTVRNALFPAVGIVVTALCAVVLGCSIHKSAAEEVSKAIHDWRRPAVRLNRGVSGELPAVPAAERSVGTGIVDEKEGREQRSVSPSPLQTYVQEALERNPSVRAAAADARAKVEYIARVTSLPDPILRAVVRPEPIQTAAGDMYFTLGVGQKIPLPARLDHAGRVAAAEVRMAIERLNAARLAVIADVEQAHYRLYLTDRSIELTEAHRQSLEELEQVLATQYRVGRAEQQDLLRIQTEIARLRDDESRLRRRRTSGAAALNQLLDYPPTRECPATRAIRPRTFEADVEKLIALAAKHNPELAALTKDMHSGRLLLALLRILRFWLRMPPEMLRRG